MTELEAAQKIRDGLLPSPWRHANMTLFAVRVTGTGMAYRDSLDEFVWRSPDLYLTDDFVERVAGLPLIWEHPEIGSLNSKEFGNRIIGTLMFGYIKGDDVWGVARVYDDEAIKLMTDGQLSTSPGVVFSSTDGNVSTEVSGGKTLLMEGRPSTLCHLAVCAAGVWDVGGPPTGVLNTSLTETETDKGSAMTEEEKAVADQARKDADDKLTAIADTLSRLNSRMDSVEAMDKARKDAEEKVVADKSRHDAARKDRFGARRDGESFKDWKGRHDADEKAMCDSLRADGDDDEVCSKTAKDARKDAEEEERRADAESFEKWAKEEGDESEHKDDKARKDAEEKDRKDAEEQARKDAAMNTENADLKARLAAMEATLKGITAETPASERDALASAQSRADSVAAMFGDRAAPPIPGEKPLDYRKRLLARFQRHSERFKESRFDSMDDASVGAVEDIVYADAVTSARSPAQTQPGQLIEFTERDRAGRTITKYAGDIAAWMTPFMTGATVGKINRNPKGN